MIDSKQIVVSVPAIADIVTQFRNDGSIPAYVIVENVSDQIGDPASIALKYQESDDGSTWADIAGSQVTVNPGASNGQIVTSSKRFIAVNAGGSVLATITVVRQVNGSTANLGDVG